MNEIVQLCWLRLYRRWYFCKIDLCGQNEHRVDNKSDQSSGCLTGCGIILQCATWIALEGEGAIANKMDKEADTTKWTGGGNVEGGMKLGADKVA